MSQNNKWEAETSGDIWCFANVILQYFYMNHTSPAEEKSSSPKLKLSESKKSVFILGWENFLFVFFFFFYTTRSAVLCCVIGVKTTNSWISHVKTLFCHRVHSHRAELKYAFPLILLVWPGKKPSDWKPQQNRMFCRWISTSDRQRFLALGKLFTAKMIHFVLWQVTKPASLLVYSPDCVKMRPYGHKQTQICSEKNCRCGPTVCQRNQNVVSAEWIYLQ